MKELKDMVVSWYIVMIIAIILTVLLSSCTSKISFTKTEYKNEKPKISETKKGI